ncbi:ribonuclease T2 family protein [Nitratireductor basaltis]|uniref:Ribonuclease T2 n=1 Tax=Nitratireductor basaltis TaxID=472175 RepID=A0A084UC31_9HYPH|nr:ribonuclease T2 [Nitratireductor basaltis]KFB10517.1 Ribonuclease T2 [Nitratireductor basaltis]
MSRSFPSLRSGLLRPLLLACAVAISGGAAEARKAEQPGNFDFYVLALSWSPSYCISEGERANRQQCGTSRPYSFIVHGLWPQRESGYPTYCASREPDRVPNRLVDDLRDLMPSAGLIGHQWRKHGSCTGASQEEYFRLLRKARERVKVPKVFDSVDKPIMATPESIEEAFRKANPQLPGDAIAVTCGKRMMREVRICLSEELDFRSCREVDRKDCRLDKVLLPPTRGR